MVVELCQGRDLTFALALLTSKLPLVTSIPAPGQLGHHGLLVRLLVEEGQPLETDITRAPASRKSKQ